jgi:hypothetical protein
MPWIRFTALLALLCTSCTQALAQVSLRLDIVGAVERPLRLDPSGLAAFDAQQLGSFTQSRTVQGVETRSSVRGVRLTALIERAGLAGKGRNDWKTVVVVATATDGYRALFSWPELANTGVGDGVLVLFERDGQPLDEREGRIALISTADRNSGPRRVRNLARIEVRQFD